MNDFSPAHRAIDAIADWPVVRDMRERAYERSFAANHDRNLFRGVFDTFEAAERSAPASRPLGYDNADAAGMYLDRTRKTYPTDYPVLFWLQKLLADGCGTIFDLGGHVGVSYYAYRKYLASTAPRQWLVHDVPAVMAEGRRLATQKDVDGRLAFSDRFDGADGVDILMAMGSLQYLPDTLPARLERLAVPPPHVIINLMPLHERHSYFTLQSIGTAFCPYRITAVGEFLRGYEELGYRMVDSWENPDKNCRIPFHPDRSLDRYHGFYFKRES